MKSWPSTRTLRLPLVCALTSLLASCGDARRTITGRSAAYTLSVRVEASAALASVGPALGWPAGAIPNARVIAARVPDGPQDATNADTAVTDASGTARFSQVAQARYVLRVSRAISVAEQAMAPALQGVSELVGTATITVSGDSALVSRVAVTAVGGSSLLITEVFPSWPAQPSGQQYYYGGYIEIYNNTDSTISLAGKAFLDIQGGYLMGPQRPNGCSIYAPIEHDPLNVWARYVFRFPDDAGALHSGESAVLATDAVDHTRFGGPGFLDLSTAAFEFKGSSDADNPNAKNMRDDAARVFEADGHGFRFRGGRQVWALARELNPDTLTRWIDPVFGGLFTRIAATSLLDLVRYDWDEPNTTPSITFCPSAIAGSIDPSDAVYLKVQDTLAIHRRVARTLPDGRIVYQSSHNSAADWITGRASPGRAP